MWSRTAASGGLRGVLLRSGHPFGSATSTGRTHHLGIPAGDAAHNHAGRQDDPDGFRDAVGAARAHLIEDIYPGCWAIEQYSKTKVCDEVTDVYGLCASMLFALSGTVPMDAPKRKKHPRLLISKAILKQLPEHVIPAIANGLQVDADRKPRAFRALPPSLRRSRRSWSRWWRPNGALRAADGRQKPAPPWWHAAAALAALLLFSLVVALAIARRLVQGQPVSRSRASCSLCRRPARRPRK